MNFTLSTERKRIIHTLKTRTQLEKQTHTLVEAKTHTHKHTKTVTYRKEFIF